MLNTILDLVFPKHCAGCNKEGSYICSDCQGQIMQKELICPRCKTKTFGGATHSLCQHPLGLDGLWSFGAFEGVLRRSIQKLKYKWITEQADLLIDQVIYYLAITSPLFLEQIKEDRGAGWAVVPVPLHWQRQNWRGFNQSALIAKKLAEALGLPYIELLKRTKNTSSQTTYDAVERKLNMKNAFSLSTDISVSSYPHILLIDDVWTTGSTMQECCTVLKRAGVQTVWAVTIAR
jgi:ComF family protein